MNQKLVNKIFSFIASLSLLVNSLSAPIIVYAQDAFDSVTTDLTQETSTPTPTPTVEATPVATETSTPTPTVEATTTADETQTATVSADTVTTDETQVTDESTTSDMPEMDLSETQEDTSAQLVPSISTNQADYSPTDTVMITGQDFSPNTEYTIEITSDTGNFKFSDTVTSDESGGLFYSYQLDGTYRPDYLVEIRDSSGNVIASTTFTDAAVPAFSWPSWSDYLVNGVAVYDDEKDGSHEDPSNGGTSVQPGEVDIASGVCKNGTPNPGTGSSVQVNLSANENYQFYRMRLADDPRAGGGNPPAYKQYHWDILVDTDHNGYADYVIDLIDDTIAVFAGTNTTNTYNGNGTPLWSAPATKATNDYTRVETATNGSCSQSWLEFAIPVSGFSGSSLSALQGANLFFSTSTSNTDPLQKDWMGFAGFIFGISKEVSTDGSTGWEESKTVTAGTNVYFRVTLTNTGNVNITGVSITDTLPAGFTYVAGSTSGVITVDPSISGQDLTWSGPFTVNAGGSIHVIFGAQTPVVSEQTIFTNTGSGYKDTSTLLGSDTAQVVVNPALGTLKVIKDVVSNNGGSASASDFTLHVKDGGGNDVSGSPAAGSDTGTIYSLQAGDYVVGEDTPTNGYEQTGFSGGCDENGNVTVAAGQEATCTITNNDIAPQLTVYKIVDNDYGGQLTSADFNINVTGTNVSPSSFVGSESGTLVSLDDGSYSVDEDFVAGYAKDLSSDCSGTIGIGESKSCTITNSDIPSTITVDKVTIPSGADDQFTFNLYSGLTLVGSAVLADATTAYTFTSLSVGTYSLTEEDLAGWDLTDISCVLNDQGIDSGSILLGLDNHAYCTFTNTQKGHLIVHKMTLPGEDQTVFTITATGSGTISGDAQREISDGESEDYEVTPGTYSVGEADVEGWKMTENTCQDVVVDPGETENCNITNTKLGKIIVEKNTDPESQESFEFSSDYGGTFYLSDGDSHESDYLEPGVYSVSETEPEGWSLTRATCSDESDPGEIDLGAGETVTCTFNNTRDTGDIGGYKFEDLNNNGEWDDGEPGLSGWTIQLWGGAEDLIDTTVTSGDPLGEYTFQNIPTGYYAVCEVLKDGWIQTYPDGCHFFTLTTDGIQGLDFGNFLPQPAVSTTKVRSKSTPGEILVGDIAQFEITVTNTGNVPLYNVIASDYFDTDYVDFVGSNPVGATTVNEDIGADTGDYDGDGNTTEHIGLLEWNLGTLDLGQSITITLTFIATAATPDPAVATNGASTTACAVNSEICGEGDTLNTEVSYASVDIDSVGISIKKSNDKSSVANVGDTVTYTLEVSNDGDAYFSSVTIKDILPGGFSYVIGSTTINSSAASDPIISGGVLEWNIDIDSEEGPDFPIALVYKATIADDLAPGIYKNFATCRGVLGAIFYREGSSYEQTNGLLPETECKVADSSVTIGQDYSYGGQLTPQVLGAATELPATGSATSLLIFALVVGGFGIATKLGAIKLERKKYAKN